MVRAIEAVLIVYGLGMISFFGLSLLSFMSNPLASAVWFLDGFALLVMLVGGFFALAAYYFWREPQREKLATHTP